MKNRFVLLAFAYLAVAACCTSSVASHGGGAYAVLYRSAWRNGIDSRLTIQAPGRDAIATVVVPQFGGVALKATMRRSDDFVDVASGTPRAEIVFAPVVRFAVGKDYEVRWSTMIPNDYQLDSLQPEIITQLHQGGNAGSPPFSLILASGKYQVDIRGDVRQSGRTFTFGMPAADEGRVVTWILRYRPDDKGADARTDLYKDGVLVVHSAGYPNAYPGDDNGYFKLGLYKWWWKTRPSDVSDRTMYYGDVEILERAAR